MQVHISLFTRSEVNLVGGVEAAVRGLLAGAGVGRSEAARAGGTGRASVFSGGALAGAFTGRARAARAASPGLDSVFGAGLVAIAVESRALTAAAGSLLGWKVVSIVG